ncbi:predicted protein [Sclerotinia sclerotiorum 1980 UF-70]|uniref:Uncharacterized protein n=1 Tax=Sclerotinia sclerotiorum (strain ATCC 18683 / 1980 / Ss-1) TaxID=665079 RepID=A7EZ30_SCLS1|nr:predicted protein [Sclerotinia sclerotiorum 1980 UF-70]EDN94722.1 predicted protein [Sclerotinia sclerotiorum 1980 UF-70]
MTVMNNNGQGKKKGKHVDNKDESPSPCESGIVRTKKGLG